MTRIRISLWNSLKRVILYILKISTKYGVAPKSFCENQNSVQIQDQDQDHDITLDFNTRPTFLTLKTPTKFCLDLLTHSKVIVYTWTVDVCTYIQTSRQTDRQTDRRKFFLACFVFWDIQIMNICQKERIFFSLMRLQYCLFLHTPYVMRK